MANKYSKLSIDKDKLEALITLWCESNLQDDFLVLKNEKQDRIQYTIKNSDKEIKIDFQKCRGGLLTICPKVGTNIPLSTQIAESIYERVCNVLKDSPFSNGFSIIITAQDFDTVIELISEMEGVSLLNFSEQMDPGIAQYKLYRFSGSAGDLITIKYYPNTSRMQMQGKPLFLFNEVVAMVSENGADQDEVVDAHLKYCNLDMKKDAVFEEIESVLGTDLYNFLSSSQKTILSTAFILRKVDGYLGDYSILLQPANRAFEGFVKKIFAQEGLECDGEKQLGMFFNWQDHLFPVMKEEYAATLDEKIEKGFTSMFKFYSQYRHPYMHASAYDYSTTIIENRKIAEEKLNEVISSMKSWYIWYKNK